MPHETEHEMPDDAVIPPDYEEDTPPLRDDTKEAALRVSGSSDVHAVAGAIANALYEDKEVSVRSIGSGALNQAMKGVVHARGYVALRGWDLLIRPGMETVIFEDDDKGSQERSAIVLKVVVVS